MILCPQCKNPKLVAEVQFQFVMHLRCSHCGWTLNPEKLQKLNLIQASTKPEFDSEVQKILETHDSNPEK